MPTSRPLRELIPDILSHIRRHTDYLAYNDRLMLVHEGQLRSEIEASLRVELSPESFKKAVKRVPSINLLTRIIDKLSRVYSEPVHRDAADETDTELLKQFVSQMKLDEKLASANRMLNLHKCVALEPFLRDGQPQLRILPAHKFLPFSDDETDPTNMTVFIKIMNRENKTVQFVDVNGRKIHRDETREVEIYYIYSDSEMLIIDSEGDVRDDKMQARELNGENPIGRIPAVYINRSDFRLIPVPDTDTLENTILIPKLLADLNYAVQFQSHSITIAVDLDVPANVVSSPDAIWAFKSTDDNGKQGRVDSIKPSVDIEKVLMLVQTTLAIWLESRNIKAGTFGQIQAANAASGIAKAIDEADATQDRQSQCNRFYDAEVELWSLIAQMQLYWAVYSMVEDRRLFTDNFTPAIRFSDQKPIVTDKEKMEEITMQMAAGLMTRKQALRKLYPYLSDEDLDKWVDELDKEAEKRKTVQPMSAPNANETQQSGQSDSESSEQGKGSGDTGGDRSADSNEN